MAKAGTCQICGFPEEFERDNDHLRVTGHKFKAIEVEECPACNGTGDALKTTLDHEPNFCSKCGGSGLKDDWKK